MEVVISERRDVVGVVVGEPPVVVGECHDVLGEVVDERHDEVVVSVLPSKVVKESSRSRCRAARTHRRARNVVEVVDELPVIDGVVGKSTMVMGVPAT